MGDVRAEPRPPVSSRQAHGPTILSSLVTAIVKPEPALTGLSPFTLELAGGGSVTSTEEINRRNPDHESNKPCFPR